MPYATTATSRTRSATASCASRSARRPDDLVGRIADLVEILNGARPGFRTLDAAKLELADALDDRRRLLVIDDAWRVQDLAPFLHRGPRTQTTRLVTTRDERLLPQDARAHRGGRDEDREAQEMLSRFMPTPMRPTLGSRLAALVVSWANGPCRSASQTAWCAPEWRTAPARPTHLRTLNAPLRNAASQRRFSPTIASPFATLPQGRSR
jgi:hypothetical protein